MQSRTQGENHLLCPLFARFNCIFIRCINICVFYLLRARNDDLVERMNGKMKKTEDTVETVSSKMKVLEGEQEKITSTIGGDRCIVARFVQMYPDEVGKIGVSLDVLLDKRNLLLFHGIDLVAKEITGPGF